MMLTHQYPLLLILILSYPSHCLLVERKSLQTIQMDLGNAYRQAIPSLFDNFQYTSLRDFKKTEAKTDAYPCRVQTSQQGTLSQRYLLHYIENVSQWVGGEQIISSFSNLKGLKNLNDAIYFKAKLFSLFKSNQVIIYELDFTNGSLAQSLLLTLDHSEKIEDGRFIVVNEQLLIISSQVAFSIQPDGSLKKLAGFNGTRTQIRDVEVAHTIVYLGLGQQGIQSYQYLSSNSSLVLLKKILFEFKSLQEQAVFKVDEFQIDPAGSYLFVLDYVQGLLQVPMMHLREFSQIYSSNAKLLVSHCENLVVLSLSIFVTCPELIQIDRQTGKVARMLHNSFYPYNMQYKDARLYLYGRESFAVYDLFGKVLDEYSLKSYSDFSLKVQKYLISFNRLGVISEYIRPRKQELYCFGDKEAQLGKYTGLLYTEGVCKEYSGPLKIEQVNDICYIQHPFELEVKDPSSLDLTFQLYVVVAWLGFSFIFGTTMAIKHLIFKKRYQPLVEEENKEVQQVSNSVIQNNLKAQKSQEFQEPA